MATKLIAISELKLAKGVDYSRSQIYRKIKGGSFPRPIRLGANRIAFVEKEIDAWIASLVEARDSSNGEGA